VSAQRIETLTWALIYGGLLSIIVGWFLTPTQGPWAELLMSGGGLAAVVGIVLIVVRSRMN
jgi:hypothetical protein